MKPDSRCPAAVLFAPFPHFRNDLSPRRSPRSNSAAAVLSGRMKTYNTFFFGPKISDNIYIMKREYKHDSLNLVQKNKLIFTSFSKKNFYLRSAISQFILVQNCVPISPFMNFDYNLANLVAKDSIRIANNSLIARCDEIWVFGEVSDGVLVEIYLAKKRDMPVRYFAERDTEFIEISQDHVRLEDVSPWMWNWAIRGKNLERWHPRLRFHKTYPLVYPAYSKRNFYWQMHISQFCLENKVIPLNPFMLFRYFLGDSVPRDTVYLANNNIVRLCDEVWTFGEISDGVLAEVKMKKDLGQPVRYYKIATSNPPTFRRIKSSAVVFEEPELNQYRALLN